MASRYRVDAVLDELGIEVLDESDGELIAQCPGHEQRTGHPDHKPSWSINADTGEHHCFSCGFGGTLAGLIGRVHKLRPAKAQRWLERYATESLAVLDGIDFEPTAAPHRVLPEYELGRFTPPPRWARKARQIRAGAIRTLGVLWDPQRQAWVTPIRDPRTGELWGWQLKGQGSRLFRNLPPGVPKTESVFGIEHARGTVLLVESPLDVVRLHGLGITAVASYGAHVSDTQMRLIVARAERLVVALDNPYTDDAGRVSAQRILQDYGQLGIWFFRYSPGSPKDPGDMTEPEIIDGVERSLHSVLGRRAVLSK